MKWIVWMLLPWLTAAGAATAQTVADASLPPGALVLRAIESTPEVRAAEAMVDRAQAEQRMRRVGPYEAQLSVIPQQRRIEGGPTYREWEVDLARGVRWPRKARLDREIGATGREAAQLMLEDAHHAAARRVLVLWSAWQRATVTLQLQRSQVELWQRERASVARRVALGDAAGRDQIALDATLAQARAAALQAEVAQLTAQLALSSQFPALPLPERVRLPSAPPSLTGSDESWVNLILARSHEIGAADALSRQRDAEARRARADRVPDPTIGLRALSDRGGRERVLGITLSIPLGGGYRGAQAAAAGADAMGAQAQLAMVSRDVRLEAQRTVALARGMHEVWRRQGEARIAAEASATRVERAYALGESGLAELLAARRMAGDTALAERQSSVDAIEAVTRVEVDAHELWHRHEDGDVDEPRAGVSLPRMGQ